MFPNIRAEMARKNLTMSDIAKGLKVNKRTLGNKLSGKTEFTWSEICRIKKSFFPTCSVEYLFSNECQDSA